MVVCDVVATLPDWEKSPGAQLEVYLADRLKIPSVEVASLTELRVMPSAEVKE
jgi:hypothetical protein